MIPLEAYYRSGTEKFGMFRRQLHSMVSADKTFLTDELNKLSKATSIVAIKIKMLSIDDYVTDQIKPEDVLPLYDDQIVHVATARLMSLFRRSSEVLSSDYRTRFSLFRKQCSGSFSRLPRSR